MKKRIVTLVAGAMVLIMGLVLPACSLGSDDGSTTVSLSSNQPVEGITIGTTLQQYSRLVQYFSMELPSDGIVQDQGLAPDYYDFIPLTERALV